MGIGTTQWVVVGAAALFLLYILSKLFPAAGASRAGTPEARARLKDAKRRARMGGSGADARAEAWREAATVALGELGRPNLAAAYAARALKGRPGDRDALRVLVESLRAARRHRALEKWLWRALSEGPGPAYGAAFVELVRLYEGPMRRPEWAKALRALAAADPSIALGAVTSADQSTANTSSK